MEHVDETMGLNRETMRVRVEEIARTHSREEKEAEFEQTQRTYESALVAYGQGSERFAAYMQATGAFHPRGPAAVAPRGAASAHQPGSAAFVAPATAPWRPRWPYRRLPRALRRKRRPAQHSSAEQEGRTRLVDPVRDPLGGQSIDVDRAFRDAGEGASGWASAGIGATHRLALGYGDGLAGKAVGAVPGPEAGQQATTAVANTVPSILLALLRAPVATTDPESVG